MDNAISIPQKVSGLHLERLAVLAREGQRPLQVPVKISYKSPLLAPLVVQSVLTWGLHPAESVLRTDIDALEQGGSDSVARNAALLVALQVADRVLSPDGADVTVAARRTARAAAEQSADLPQVASGVTVGADRTVIAVDHVPGCERPRGIYPTRALDEEARSLFAGAPRTDVSRLRGRPPLGHRALSIGISSASSWGELYAAAGSALGTVLFELLQNTELHARHDVLGKPLAKSVRLMHVRTINERRAVLERSDPDNYRLMEYFHQAQREPSSGEDDRIRFLVVSVMDSGPGLARTLLRRENKIAPETPKEELTFLLRALRMTSSGTTNEPMRGRGLRRVQTLLTELGGYARVRSGRFELQRDFIRSPFTESEQSDRTWFGGASRPTATDMLTGTSFTLVLPLPPDAEAEKLWGVMEDES